MKTRWYDSRQRIYIWHQFKWNNRICRLQEQTLDSPNIIVNACTLEKTNSHMVNPSQNILHFQLHFVYYFLQRLVSVILIYKVFGDILQQSLPSSHHRSTFSNIVRDKKFSKIRASLMHTLKLCSETGLNN